MKERLFLSASSHYTLYRPSLCERRVYLTAHAEKGEEPSELEQIIMELGRRHEEAHLATFSGVRNLADGSLADRAERTRDAVAGRAPVIYQGVLRAVFPGATDIVTGIPDFMIADGASYRIRDCKLSRGIQGGKHPEIIHQLQTYGWLFEKTFERPPAGLEALLGDGSLVPVPYNGADDALRELARIRELSLRPDEPWEPVGWSKCGGCPFQARCWAQAEKDHDVSMIYKVDAGTARALRERGIRTWDELVEKMDDDGLAGLPRPRRVGEQRVGAAAGRILAQARALSSGKVVDIGRLSLPEGRRLVMFDLEGIPPQYEELEKVYLWGMQLHDGGRKGAYTPAVADFGPDGDRQGWTRFLKNAEALFNRHGDVPFVHWAGYEKSKIKTYIERHGDRDGIARRVLCNCFDLLQAVRDAYALPVPSYSLKVIEGLAGYTRTMEEYGGDWSIGRYIRAGETRDEAERTRIMSEILRYNQEDLQATWAVLQWVRGLRGRQLTLPFLPDTA